MRIAKYIFLLFFLAAIALSVFILTQPAEFAVEKTKVVSNSKDQTFHHIDDFSTWQKWYSPTFLQNNAITIDNNTLKGNDFSLNKINSFTNDSILYQIKQKDYQGKSKFQLSKIDSISTKITWIISGKMDVKLKFLSFLNGGIENLLLPNMELSLNNLYKQLNQYYTVYKIENEGIVTKSENYYISITDSCSFNDFDTARKKDIATLSQKLKHHRIKANDASFVIFDEWNTNTRTTIFQVCLPVKEPNDSIIKVANIKKMNAYLAFKTTLNGDYSYREKAWNETFTAIENSNHTVNEKGTFIEVYKSESKKIPANNLTEIYIPVYFKELKKQSFNNTSTDTVSENEQITPTAIIEEDKIPETVTDSL